MTFRALEITKQKKKNKKKKNLYVCQVHLFDSSMSFFPSVPLVVLVDTQRNSDPDV